MASISGGFSALGVVFAFMGQPGALMLIPMGCLFLLDWFTIRVDRTEVTFSHLLWKRRLPIAEIGIEGLRERTPMTRFPAPNRLHVWFARRPLVQSQATCCVSRSSRSQS